MPTPSAEAAIGSEAILDAQVATEDAAAIAEQAKPKQGKADPSTPAAALSAAADPAGEPAPAAEPQDPPADPAADPAADLEKDLALDPAAADPAPADPDADPPVDPKDLTIGNRTFATVTDMVTEARRILGHNANQAGDITRANEAVLAAQRSLQTTKDELAQAQKLNQDWQDWHKKQSEGDPSIAPGFDPDTIAAKTADILEKNRTEGERKAQVLREIQQVEALANFSQVSDLFIQLADKTNPLTDKYFTPVEAYKYACKEREVEDLLKKGDTGILPTPAPAPVPKPGKPAPVAGPGAKVVASAAARPATAPARAPVAPPVKPSEADEELSAGFHF